MPKKYPKKDILRAIDGSGGFVSVVAERLGCSRQSVHNWRRKWEDVQQAFREEREKQLDEAEGQLQKLIGEGNLTAIIFYLKTQGKARGYVERQEVVSPELIREAQSRIAQIILDHVPDAKRDACIEQIERLDAVLSGTDGGPVEIELRWPDD